MVVDITIINSHVEHKDIPECCKSCFDGYHCFGRGKNLFNIKCSCICDGQ